MRKETEKTDESRRVSAELVRFCYECGAALPEENEYCGKCGQLRRSALGQEQLNRAVSTAENLPLQESGYDELSASPLFLLDSQGVDAAISAMTKDYYEGRKQEISKDGAKILSVIYAPFIMNRQHIKDKSPEGRQTIALGRKLDELEGWLGMVKTYSIFKNAIPTQQENLAELWSGIGEWAK